MTIKTILLYTRYYLFWTTNYSNTKNKVIQKAIKDRFGCKKIIIILINPFVLSITFLTTFFYSFFFFTNYINNLLLSIFSPHQFLFNNPLLTIFPFYQDSYPLSLPRPLSSFFTKTPILLFYQDSYLFSLPTPLSPLHTNYINNLLLPTLSYHQFLINNHLPSISSLYQHIYPLFLPITSSAFSYLSFFLIIISIILFTNPLSISIIFSITFFHYPSSLSITSITFSHQSFFLTNYIFNNSLLFIFPLYKHPYFLFLSIT